MTNPNKILAVIRPNRPKPEDIKPSETKTESKTDSKPEPSISEKPSPRPRPSGNSSDRPSRPSRPKPKTLLEVPEAANAAGEVFHPGDQIWVRSPWGKWAVAEIQKFYQSTPDEIVAYFSPKEERSGWTWMGGCIRSKLLKKVETPEV